MTSSQSPPEGDSLPIDDIRPLFPSDERSLTRDDVHSLTRPPIHSTLATTDSQPSYVISSLSQAQSTFGDIHLGTAAVSETSNVPVQRLEQPMNLSLILSPDSLPKSSFPALSTSSQNRRHFFDPYPVETQFPTDFAHPIFTPTLRASLKRILDEPPPSSSEVIIPGPSMSRGHERALTAPTAPPKLEASRQRSVTGGKDFAKQRSIQGTKLITNYFSPSQSPKKVSHSVQSSTFTSANALQQFQSSTVFSATVTQDVSQSVKRLLPAFSDDVYHDPPKKRARLEYYLSNSPEIHFHSPSDLEAMLIDDNEAQDAVELIATPVENISSLSLQPPKEGISILEDKLPISGLLPPFTERDDYESQDDVTDEMFVSDDDDAQGSSSDSESFHKYDPYFDIFETPRRKAASITVGERVAQPIPTSRSPTSARPILAQQFQRYELMTNKGARKPYLSKRARGFLNHLADFEEFNNYRNEIIHVDFSAEEVETLRKYQAVPGRTREDCIRFQEDYPDLSLDYDNACFIRVSAAFTHSRSHSDFLSIPASFSRQRHRSELGVKSRRSDRELQTLLSLIPCSTFNHASGDVIDFKFSPVNNQFAVCCNTLTNDYNRPGNLLFGDATREIVSTLNGHADRTVGAERYYTVSDIRFSNDGQYLYSGSYDNTVKIWDMKGEMLGCLTGHGRITALSTTYCSERVLAVASDDGNVYLYDVLNPSKQRRTVLLGQNDRLCGAFLVPGQGVFAHWMLAGYEAKDTSSLGALYAYDISTGKMIQRILPASNSQSAAYFHPSANHFVVGATGPFNNAGPTAKSVVRVYDPRIDKVTMQIGLDSPQKDINKVTLSPCGFRVTSSGTDGKTFVWDLRSIRESTEPDPLHILAHGSTKMVSPVDGQLEDWDTGVSVAEWLPQSDYLMTGASDGLLKLWDTRLGTPFVRNIAEFDSAIGSADFNCDRDMLGVGESSGRVTFLDWHGPLDGGELRKFQLQQAVIEGTGNEGIMAARELLASGRVAIREYHGLRSVFAV